MSTTADESAIPGTTIDASVNPPPLPPLNPARLLQDRRLSRADSSTSGSRWSAADRQSRSPSEFRTSLSMTGSNDGNQEQQLFNTIPSRNPNRSSGGFLLEPATHSSRLSSALLSRPHKDRKGKRKSESLELSVSKKRERQLGLDQGSSHRSSPLSVEVQPMIEGQNQGHYDSLDATRRQQDRTFLQDGHSDTTRSQRSGSPSVGFDTDPAQIVDMALKLNEGRRRQASGRRFVSGETPAKRVISTASSRQLRTPTKNFVETVAHPNLITSSPLSGAMHDGTAGTMDDPMKVDDPFASPMLSRYASNTQKGTEISRATAARVDKAKTYLDLAYEHRRLLSHLPPIRRPDTQNRPGDDAESRIYNPLQYVRNRKLRIRERTAMAGEDEGWYDVEKVRAWVDAVVDGHEEIHRDPLECVRLPPLTLQDNDEDEPLSPKFPNGLRSPKPKPAKPRRPKSDWVTHPGDLIADAFWLEQGLNKMKLVDRDNRPIFPPDTQFKFSGWRNMTPPDIPQRLQEPTPPPEDQVEEKPQPLSAAPQLPTFRSAHKKDKQDTRGRKITKLRGTLGKTSSKSRKLKDTILESSSDTDSDSDSGASPREPSKRSPERGRKLDSEVFDLPDGDPFGQPITSIAQGPDINRANSPYDGDLSGRDSKRPSVDNSRLVSYLKRNNVLKPSSHDRGRSQGDSKKHHRFFHHSQDRKESAKGAPNSAEEDSTAPSSPINYGMPSIAMNLDAPVSRSPSPTKRVRPNLLQSFKDKSRYSDHERVDTNDFAKRSDKSHSRDASVDAHKANDSSNQTSRGTSPFSKLRRESTPQDDWLPAVIDQKSSPLGRQNTRPVSVLSQNHPSKIRGIFKGGRIAELVGNEVSRVGDFIWKRDVPNAYRHQRFGSEESFPSYEPSDTDEDAPNGTLYRTPTRDALTGSIAQSVSGGRNSQEIPRTQDKQQFHNPNLPNFTSPFQRDRDKQDKKPELLTPEDPRISDDPVSRQAAQLRSRSKSPRFDRLAPPKLDTSAPRSVGVVERRNSYGFGAALTRSQSASRMFNDAIKQRASQPRSAKSSIIALPNHFRQSVDHSLNLPSSDHVDKRSISRIEALLLVSAVKAKNMNLSYEQLPREPSKILVETIGRSSIHIDKSQLLQVRKRDEYVLAARGIIAELSRQSADISTRLHAFTDTTVTRLHRETQILEDQIENSITPRVSEAADSAGALSVKLTTTSTQLVKAVQDEVSEAFRIRRRGPFRWLRLLWYMLIEWFVVGLLWFIWAIVTVLRVVRGTVTGTVRTVQWLLWIK